MENMYFPYHLRGTFSLKDGQANEVLNG